MQVVCTLFGILTFIGVIVAFFPCFGALNWLNVPLSITGLLISSLVHYQSKRRFKVGSFTGMVLCGIAIAIGMFRLGLGFGIL